MEVVIDHVGDGAGGGEKRGNHDGLHACDDGRMTKAVLVDKVVAATVLMVMT